MTLHTTAGSRLALLLILAASIAGAARQASVSPVGDWPSFGRDAGAQRYSPLTQINKQNVGRLQQAWSFDTGARDLQVTPLVINGVMYLTAGSAVLALTPESGDVKWKFDAGSPVGRRGVAYWPGDRAQGRPRLFVGVAGGRMAALDAETGALVAEFGEKGYVDLTTSIRGDVDGPFMLDSPPVVYGSILITGGSNGEGSPSSGLYGDIRGWDAISGKLLWSFHTVPRAGEPGVETWEGESWKDR